MHPAGLQTARGGPSQLQTARDVVGAAQETDRDVQRLPIHNVTADAASIKTHVCRSDLS